MKNPYEYMKRHEGQIIPYKEFCDILELEELKGVQRTRQLKELSAFMDIKNNRGMISINKIYDMSYLDKDMSDLDNIKWFIKHSERLNDNRLSLFSVHYTLAHSSGIYKIQKDNKIYIGQTVDFLARFYQHYSKSNPYQQHTYDLLQDGGKFEVVEIIEDLDKRLLREKYWIDYYKDNKDFECMNVIHYLDENEKVKPQPQKYCIIKVKPDSYERTIEYLKDKNVLYE